MDDVLTVVIADGHPPTRAALRATLEASSCQVVAEAGDAASAVAAVIEHRPDVCLLDVHLPGTGIAAAARAARAAPRTAAVLMTSSHDAHDLLNALRASAWGYLFKDMDPDRLVPALRGVRAGEIVLPRRLVIDVMAEAGAAPQSRLSVRSCSALARLTNREAEVLELLGDGLSTERIASRLFVAQVTIRTHVRAILRKLQVADRQSAVRLSRGETQPA
ncbi:DNA-binding response regulator, NarL/FixJ family, contains REC and HTH domains [Modestobacter sp. DSM 44400]|nr:DNA-binding response regulator, NarL/FixJ family, contains REC and HTH domains [Modestobacter sp. DSM 44400]